MACSLFVGCSGDSRTNDAERVAAAADHEPDQRRQNTSPAPQVPRRRSLVCRLRSGQATLPASKRHGLIDHLLQYPDVTLATRAQRVQAERVLAQLMSAAEAGNWANIGAAERAGYNTRTAPRKPGDLSIRYFHAERLEEPRGKTILDPRRPKALIYANAPGRPLALVGAMWSMRPDELGPTPGGPITRWHTHVVCAKRGQRGVTPPGSGKCPPGTKLIQGRSEMFHVWFTRDLRSAFAIRAPEPELCTAGLLPRGYCEGVEPPEPASDPTATLVEAAPAIEAAFERESYAPGETARLVVSSRATDLELEIRRSGPERVPTRDARTMNGVLMTQTQPVGSSDGSRSIRLRIGDWESGLYFARLRSTDGNLGFAPFVVRPRHLGEQHVAIVLPTLTWQAYNLRDDDGDGFGDSWYTGRQEPTVRLGRPHLNRGVPYGFRYQLPFIQWLQRTGRRVDVLAQSDLEGARSPRALRRAYDLLVFPGHHEYVTTREYDLVEGFRNRGGSLAFLSANNFFWRVVRHGRTLKRAGRWRELGRPEAALVGVQYLANRRSPRRPWVVRRAPATSWMFAGTGLSPGSRMSRGGVEIDQVALASPKGIQIVAEIPNLFGPGKSAQMTYYETRAGARVFAAGAFHLTRVILRDPGVARMIENVWARLAVSTRLTRVPSPR